MAIPTWDHANIANFGPRVQDVTTSQRPEKLGRLGRPGSGGIRLFILRGNVVCISLIQCTRTVTIYCDPAGLEVL